MGKAPVIPPVVKIVVGIINVGLLPFGRKLNIFISKI